jgi:succinate dehydrogenase / fumarate reductase, cytochrome b subunit
MPASRTPHLKSLATLRPPRRPARSEAETVRNPRGLAIGKIVAAALTSRRTTRPTSPHWQIYRWQIGNTLSIMHRITGSGLALGLLALSYWLICVAAGESSYAVAAKVFSSAIGILFLMGWTFAFMFHFLNGLRHLFWDAGRGFEKTQRHLSGWFAVVGAVLLTLMVWLWIWRHLA